MGGFTGHSNSQDNKQQCKPFHVQILFHRSTPHGFKINHLRFNQQNAFNNSPNKNPAALNKASQKNNSYRRDLSQKMAKFESDLFYLDKSLLNFEKYPNQQTSLIEDRRRVMLTGIRGFLIEIDGRECLKITRGKLDEVVEKLQFMRSFGLIYSFYQKKRGLQTLEEGILPEEVSPPFQNSSVSFSPFLNRLPSALYNSMEQPSDLEERALDSTSALEKVLRLDKKHTNFDYQDLVRNLTIRVAYPQLQPEGPSSEALLKSLWRHACNYYFKPIEDSQLRRLHYIKDLMRAHTEGNYRFDQCQDFWDTLESLFSHDYLHKYLKGQTQRQQLQNSLEMMHIVWRLAVSTHSVKEAKAGKRKEQNYNKLLQDLSNIWQSEHSKEVPQRQKLQLEARRLKDELVYPSDPHNEINQQIARLERELKQAARESTPIIQKLEQRVVQEATLQDILYCQNDNDDDALMIPEHITRVDRKLSKLQSFEILTKYIEYTIRQLEKKQIAESVSKILRVEKNKGELKMVLGFEESMGIKPITVTETEFHSINDLREYSLLKFYNTASKSPYSFVCQNYLGFRDIYEHRHRPCSLKDKNIVQEMRRSSNDLPSAAYNKEFAKMEICHHCKLLHPESALVRCEYRSSRCGNPVPPSPYYDSYIYQILKNEQSRVSAIRFLNSNENRRNSYFHYLKKEDEYVCERKYCRYCLKNYEESKDKSCNLCPYCRGICYCTRCTRNDTIVRLKSLYVLLGGDINQLQQEGIFQKYYSQPDPSIALRRKDHHKHSRRNLSAPNRANEKMLNIRYQLQDLRLICDLVKRREKNKQKLHNCMREAFLKKIQLIDPDFRVEAPKSLSEPKQVERQREEEKPQVQKREKVDRTGPVPNKQLSLKLAKKLRRMID